MPRRLMRCAVPLCVFLAGLLAGQLPLAPSLAHVSTASAWSATVPEEVVRQASSARLGRDAALADVSGVSGTAVWAVGQTGLWDVWRNRGIVTRWNGASWTEVPTRGDATGAGPLRSVSAASDNEVWVVGDGHDGVPYVGRGGGSGIDRVVVPQVRAGDWLRAVAAEPGRAVIVGSRGGRVLVVTSGPAWKVHEGPDGVLHGVALRGKDGWAVGNNGDEPLIMRLSGGSWKPVSLPGIEGGYLRDVYITSARRAVAVGGVFTEDGTTLPLILRWDGRKWHRETLPDGDAELYGVTGDGKGGYWASGYDAERPGEAFLLRYTDKKWKPLRGEAGTGDRSVRLQAVVRADDVTMAVGHVLADDHYSDLVETFGPVPGSPVR
ncbi:hypothetical protein [Herbidospora yilanensis]|uniref:hypothetical protein n=1 Tax=Herbidospora yilanensis TaxID=354426 RepID=UPI000785BDD3|nr:hypothetical protein [Herbidospora yilanensis]